MREKSCKKGINISKNTTKLLAGALAAMFVVSALIGCGGGTGAYADSGDAVSDRGSMIFTDVKNDHWAYANINAMVKAGAVNGYPDGSFRPSENVTYGEFIKMMYMALNGSVLIGGAENKEHWAAPYYYAALAEKYFDAGSIEIDILDKKMPRKHMAHASAGVIRALERDTKAEFDGKINGKAEEDSIEFTDVLPAGEYAYDIMTACESGILSGYPDGTFGGNRTLTRAEATAVIGRLTEYKATHAAAAGSEEPGEAEEQPANSGLLPGEKKSGKKIVRRVEKADRIIPVSYEVVDSTFGAKGIEKLEYDGEGTIKIYSSVEYPFIKIMKEDGSLMESIGSPDGSFFREGGMYVYLADSEGQSFNGGKTADAVSAGNTGKSDLYLIFDDESGMVYRFAAN